MRFKSVGKVKIPKYLAFLIILLITTGLAFTIVAKAQKRAALIVEENRFFYWRAYESELVFFRYPSNYFIQEESGEVVIFKDELRRGKPELSVWFDEKKAEKIEKNVLSADINNIIFKLAYNAQEVNYENEFNLIIESVKIKK